MLVCDGFLDCASVLTKSVAGMTVARDIPKRAQPGYEAVPRKTLRAFLFSYLGILCYDGLLRVLFVCFSFLGREYISF